MDISTYQRHAAATDQKPLTAVNDDGVVVPLLGLAGEVGSLQAAYKMKLRDGDDYRLFGADVAEELGDIMWYVANLANKFDLDLSQILTHSWPAAVDVSLSWVLPPLFWSAWCARARLRQRGYASGRTIHPIPGRRIRCPASATISHLARG